MASQPQTACVDRSVREVPSTLRSPEDSTLGENITPSAFSARYHTWQLG